MSNTEITNIKGYSQTGRAQYQRRSRVYKANERRFNNPLRAFIEHKYPSIFTEYAQLYETMNRSHPHRKNLTKTSIFKHWVSTSAPESTSVENSSRNDIINQALREAIASIEQNPPADEEDQQLPPAVQQTPQQLPPPVQQGPQQRYDNIDQILDEMAADQDIRNMLDQPNPQEDEGIELNLLDEIYDDIQPLDYTLEVEPGEL